MKNELFKKFGPSLNIYDIKLLIADIAENVEKVKDTKEDEGIEDDGTNIAQLQAKLDILTESVDQMADYLNKMESTLDKATLPILKQVVSSAVINYSTAYDCTTFYTKGWFSRSFLSLEGKVEFAQFLIQTVSPYCKSNMETWKMVVERNAEMVLYISWFRNDE